MKTSVTTLLLFLSNAAQTHGCPYSKNIDNGAEIPCDGNHRHLRRRVRFASLSEDEETKAGIARVIQDQKKKHDEKRNLITTTCVSQSDYDSIHTSIAAIAREINDDGDRGHFFGGIVRLAAHDFMDFDVNSDSPLGPDGCLDFDNAANAGLPSIWCDNETLCPLKALYDSSFASFMSRADFWVAAANAVIRETSVDGGLDLPFRWGRADSDSCPESSARLPEASGCGDVEATFIDRMELSWADAVALMGAHSLGRGHEEFSGHPGTWVQNDEESTIFDKGFYTELLNRGWRPRTSDAGTDWTWGGNNRGVMMLNTDICLAFDIPDGDLQGCCTNTNQNCRDPAVNNIQCPTSEEVRPSAFTAIQEIVDGRRNDIFYARFASAWQRATEIGQDSLNDLVDTCEDITRSPVASPTSLTRSPVASPTSLTSSPVASPTSLTRSPVASPTSLTRSPVASPTSLTRSPVASPTSSTNSPVSSPPDCEDKETFKNNKGKRVDCDWVLRKNKCRKYSKQCPVSCNACGR